MRNPGHRQPHLHTGQGAQQAQVIEVAEMADPEHRAGQLRQPDPERQIEPVQRSPLPP